MSSKYNKTIFFLFLTVTVIVAGFYVLQSNEIFMSSAGSDDNFSGYAWSENFGWISFNCTNEGNCGDSDYGVDLDMESGDFSGYAWSENIGWIDFAPDGPYPGAPAHGVKYEYEDTGDERRVTGWAKALVLGDKGWIKMHPDPWLEGWSKRRQITVDHDKIDSPLNDFPVPVFINGSAGLDNDDVISVFDEVGTSSKKIAVTGPSGNEQLYAEVESWDSSAEEAVIWVGGSGLDIASSSDTHLYLYYDNEQEDNDEYITTGTDTTILEQIWGDDYAMVQHLNEESGDALDSSPHGNDGTLNGGVTQGAAGQVDGAYDFDGGDDHVEVGNSSELTEFEEFTITAWVVSGAWSPFFHKNNQHRLRYRTASNDFEFTTSFQDAGDKTLYSEDGLQDDTWYYVAMKYDGEDFVVYLNGVEQDRINIDIDTVVENNNSIILGARADLEYFFGKKIDEVRIYNRDLSSEEITAQYEADRDNLLTWGKEETGNYGVTADIHTGIFSGWAWNKNKGENYSGIGWISFNCADDGAGGCTNTDYNVQAHLNTAPQVTDMTAPNWSHANACSQGAKNAFLDWDIDDPDEGASAGAYHVIVDDSEDMSGSNLIDTGEVEGKTTQHHLSPDDLDYGQSYSWWVKVWDNHKVSSSFNQYDTEPDTHNDDGNVHTFTVYEREFPDVDFYHIPQSVSIGEDVEFTSTSTRYTNDDPDDPVNCTTSTCSDDWTIPDSAIVKEGDPDASSTIILEFTEEETYPISLQVGDTEGYSCATSTAVEVKPPLPEWREIKVD